MAGAGLGRIFENGRNPDLPDPEPKSGTTQQDMYIDMDGHCTGFVLTSLEPHWISCTESPQSKRDGQDYFGGKSGLSGQSFDCESKCLVKPVSQLR